MSNAAYADFNPTPEQRAAVAKAYRLVDPSDPITRAIIQEALENAEFEYHDFSTLSEAVVRALGGPHTDA